MNCHHCARSPRKLASWIVPGSLLVLMPKCPVCLAGYIALATGLGISIPAATNLRMAMLSICVVWLCLLAIRVIVLKTRHSSR